MTGLPASLRLPRKPAGTARQGFGATSRLDDWATEPGIVGLGFTAFILYSLFSALLWYPLFGVAYEVDGYLSPFFSPLIRPDWMPDLVLAGDPHPVDPARLPDHLLLLPQGLLPLVLRRSTRLRGRRAQYPQGLPDGDGIPVHPPEPPPLLPVPRVHPALLPVARRVPVVPARGSVADRARDAGPAAQRRPAERAIRCPATRSATWSVAISTASRAAAGPRPATSCGAGPPG